MYNFFLHLFQNQLLVPTYPLPLFSMEQRIASFSIKIIKRYCCGLPRIHFWFDVMIFFQLLLGNQGARRFLILCQLTSK